MLTISGTFLIFHSAPSIRWHDAEKTYHYLFFSQGKKGPANFNNTTEFKILVINNWTYNLSILIYIELIYICKASLETRLTCKRLTKLARYYWARLPRSRRRRREARKDFLQGHVAHCVSIIRAQRPGVRKGPFRLTLLFVCFPARNAILSLPRFVPRAGATIHFSLSHCWASSSRSKQAS